MTHLAPRARGRRAGGFTLIELMITVAIVAILARVAMPSYTAYVKRGSREAAQAQLVEMSGIQEKIFLNTNAYTSKVSNAYDGTTSGGLGMTGGRTRDGRYTLSVTVSGASYTLSATPVSGSSQDGDGTLSLDSAGQRTWGSKSW